MQHGLEQNLQVMKFMAQPVVPFGQFSFQDQLDQHVDPNIQLNTYVYYGSERNKDLTVLSKQDIVLTTYNVLATDYGVSIPKNSKSFFF